MTTLLAPSCASKDTHPFFRARQYDGYTQGSINNLDIVVIPYQREIAYSNYLANIDVFVSSTNRQMTLNVEVQGAFLSNNNRPLIPLDLPAISFISGVALTRDQEDGLVKKLEKYEVERKTVAKTTLFVIRGPTDEIKLMENMLKASKDWVSPVRGTTNPEGFQAIHFVRKCISEFLATNTYAAFGDDEDNMDDEIEHLNHLRIDMDAKMSTVAQRATQFVKTRESAASKAAREKAVIDQEIRNGKEVARRAKLASLPEGEAPMDEDKSELPAVLIPEVVKENFIDHYTVKLAYDIVHRVRPSTSQVTINYGPVASVPSLPGRVFPYFVGMTVPDRRTITTIIHRHFFRCMGDSVAECKAYFSSFKRAMESVSGLEVGNVLAHILTGIDFCLSSQTRLFLIMDGNEYNGFVLLGKRWGMNIGHKWVEAVDTTELADHLSKLGSHSNAVKEIARILSELPLLDGITEKEKEVVKVESLGRSSDIWREIRTRKVGVDAKKELQKALGKLMFARTYRQINDENIIIALREMTVDAHLPLDPNIPVFIPFNLSNMADKAMEVLATFGPESFSFMNLSGQRYNIPPLIDDKPDPNEVKDAKGKKALPVISIARKNLDASYADWRKVLTDRVLQVDLGERALKHRTNIFSGPARDRVYAALKEFVGRKDAKDQAELGKRKRGDEDGTDGSDHPNSYAAALALWD